MSAPAPITPRRLLAVFLAGLYAVGAFAGLLHVAAVEHARCAEHGEIVHVEAPLLRADLSVLSFEESRLRSAAPDEHHGEHDHCALNVPSSQETFTFARPGVTAPLVHEAPVLVPALADLHLPHGEGLYRLAPKQGPPLRT